MIQQMTLDDRKIFPDIFHPVSLPTEEPLWVLFGWSAISLDIQLRSVPYFTTNSHINSSPNISAILSPVTSPTKLNINSNSTFFSLTGFVGIGSDCEQVKWVSHPRGFLLPEWVLCCPHGTCSIRRELRATHILAKDLRLYSQTCHIMGLVRYAEN